MAVDYEENAKTVKFLHQAYRSNKAILKMADSGISYYSNDRIRLAKKICYRMEVAIEMLDDRYRLVLESDIIHDHYGHKDKYLISTAFYYKYRKQAYEAFLKELEK